jgi:hypothetical protein
MFRALMLSLIPALVILAFRTLCTSKPAPTPKYLEKPNSQWRAAASRRSCA